MSNFSLLELIIVAGLLTALNPFNIGLFSALIAGTFGKGHPRATVHAVVASFLFTYSVFLALLSVGLIEILDILPIKTVAVIGLMIALMAVLWGLVLVKEFFWYGIHDNIPHRIYGVLHKYTVKRNNPAGGAILGIITAGTSLLNVSIQILSLSVIIALSKPNVEWWGLLVPLVFVMPLIIIFIFSLRRFKISAILKWKEDSKAIMRLSGGLTLIILGWVILLLLNGVIGSIL